LPGSSNIPSDLSVPNSALSQRLPTAASSVNRQCADDSALINFVPVLVTDNVRPSMAVNAHAMYLHRRFEQLHAAIRTFQSVVGMEAFLVHPVNMAVDQLPFDSKTPVNVRDVSLQIEWLECPAV
jgi:hypothetical protein